MIKKIFFTLFTALLSLNSMAAFSDADCGPFALRASHDGFMHINGVRPVSQKVNFLNQKDDFDNVELLWNVADPRTGQWYGMDYIKHDGKAILNVEQIQAGIDAPRVFGSYDCVHVK